VKKLALISTGVVVLLIAGLLVGRHLAIGFLTPEYLVQEIEKRWNCRAEVEDLKVTLLGDTGLELIGVRLGPPDEYVKNGTAPDERPPMENVEVSAGFAHIEVEAGDLFKRRISIKKLVIKDVKIRTKVRHNGRISVQELFESPGRDNSDQITTGAVSESSKPASVAEVNGKTVTVQVSGDLNGDKDKEKFSAEDMEVSAFADNVEIKNAQIVATLASGNSIVTLSNFELKLSQIEIDPADLLKHNHASFVFSGDLAVEDSKTKVKQISLSLRGDGEVQPFDPASGMIDPRWVSNMTIEKGSAINTFPMIEKLNKLLSGVDTAGVNLDDLNVRGELTNDASTRIAGHAGKFELKKNLALPLPDTAFVFAAGSWLDSGSNQHQLLGTVMASEDLTAKLSKKVDTYLKKKAKSFYSKSLTELVLQPAMKEGRIAFDFVSKGDLGDPKVDILTPFGSLTDLLDQGKDTLKTLKEVGKSLLKGLFGK